MTQLFERNPLPNQELSDETQASSFPRVSRLESSPLPSGRRADAKLRRQAAVLAKNKNPVTLICESMERLDEWDAMPLRFKHLRTGLELVVDPVWLTIGFSENSDVRIPLSLLDRWRLINGVKRLSSAKVSTALIGDALECPINALRESMAMHTHEWQVHADVVTNERAVIEIITTEGMFFLRFGMYSRLRFPFSMVGRIRLWRAIKRLIRQQVSRQFQGLL